SFTIYLLKRPIKIPTQQQNKPKTININLTQPHYQKLKHLPQITNLNPTPYTPLLPLPNPIKPTLLQIPSTQITIHTNKHLQHLKSQPQPNAYYANIFKPF
uniref:hypothetical protein n=1 Tax=Staphylococcus saprophyticus TaxID=29385 RepID=UPI001C92BBB2